MISMSEKAHAIWTVEPACTISSTVQRKDAGSKRRGTSDVIATCTPDSFGLATSNSDRSLKNLAIGATTAFAGLRPPTRLFRVDLQSAALSRCSGHRSTTPGKLRSQRPRKLPPALTAQPLRHRSPVLEY